MHKSILTLIILLNLFVPIIASAQPTILSHPKDCVVVVDQTPGFGVSATGTGVLSYQWYYNGVAVEDSNDFVFFPDPATELDEGSEFYVVVTDDTGSSTSNPAHIRVEEYRSDIEMPIPDASLATYHIDATNGSDTTGDGSAASPYASFSSVKPLLQGGEIVLFHEGSYASVSFNRADGEFSDWVVLMAAPGEEVTLPSASFRGTGDSVRATWGGNYEAWVRLIGLHITDGVNVSNANCIRIEQCLVNLSAPLMGSIGAVDRSTIGIRGGRSVTIEDCEITEGAIGATLRGADLTLRRSHIHHISHDGIRVSGSNIVRIEYNDIYNSDDGVNDSVAYARHADGIHISKEQDGSEDPIEFNNNLIIRGNRIFNHEAMTIMAQGSGASSNWLIENNIFGPSGGFALHLKLAVAKCVYRHNSLVHVPNESYEGLFRTINNNSYATALPAYSTSSEVDIYNNIFYGPTRNQEFVIGMNFTDVYDNNLYYDRSYTFPSIGTNPILVEENPMLDPGSYDGVLKADSEAIGSGTTYNPAEIDIYGTPRPETPSIGAVEPVDYSDSENPTIPENLVTDSSIHSIDLSWDPATDNQLVSGYILYRDGAELVRTHRTTFTDRALKAETTYTYSIQSFDPAGNLSGLSGTIEETTGKSYTDVALGRPVVADTETGDGPATFAVDGAPVTFWEPSGSDSHWLEIDLETDYQISGFSVSSGLAEQAPIASFNMEAWMDEAWVAITDAVVTDNTSEVLTIELDAPLTTSMVRFVSTEETLALNSIEVFGDALDTEAPTAPGGLSADPMVDQVALTWSPSEDDVNVAGYIIYRGLDVVGRVTEPEYTDYGLYSNASYTYSVVAYDSARNESESSEEITVRTLSVPGWAGIDVVDLESTVVNTGDWLGYIDVAHAPWVWSYTFQNWIYAPDPGDVRATWMYLQSPVSLDPGFEGDHWAGYPVDEEGIVHTDDWLGDLFRSPDGWMWHYDSNRWIYSGDGFTSNHGAWIWIEQYFWNGQTSDWTSVDYGNVGIAGTIDCVGGTITVTGDGTDVWGSRDHTHFPYMKLSGDFDISVRVKSAETVSDWTKSGIMIRGYDSAVSNNVFMLSSPNGSQFQVRVENDGATTWGNYVDGQILPTTTPTYLRVTREGDLFTGYFSDDGVNWTMRSNETVVMPDEVFFGLAVSSHLFESISTIVFDRLLIKQ